MNIHNELSRHVFLSGKRAQKVHQNATLWKVHMSLTDSADSAEPSSSKAYRQPCTRRVQVCSKWVHAQSAQKSLCIQKLHAMCSFFPWGCEYQVPEKGLTHLDCEACADYAQTHPGGAGVF